MCTGKSFSTTGAASDWSVIVYLTHLQSPGPLFFLSDCLYLFPSVCLSIYLSTYISHSLSISLSIYIIYLYHLSLFPSFTYLPHHLPSPLSSSIPFFCSLISYPTFCLMFVFSSHPSFPSPWSLPLLSLHSLTLLSLFPPYSLQLFSH